MNHWISAVNDFSALWVAAMFRACWQGGLALALAWALCRIFHKMPARVACWLWRLAYLKMLVAISWGVPIDLPVLRALPPDQSPVPEVGEAATPAASLQPSAPFLPSPPIQPRMTRPSARSVLLGLWLLALGLHAAWMMRQWRLAVRMRRQSRDAGDPALVAIWADLCRRCALNKPPPLLVSDELSGPLLVGIRHPSIILPAILCRDCTPTQLRLMLAHELSHLRRHDLLWNWLPTIVHCLFFFHPVLWLVRRQWRMAQEIACDQAAVSATHASTHDYGQMLLSVVGHRAADVPPVASLGVAESRINIERRLAAMKQSHLWSGKRYLFAAVLLVLAAVVGIAPWRLVAQQPESPPPPGTNAKPAESASRPATGETATSPAPTGPSQTVDLIGIVVATTAEIRATGDGLIQQVLFEEGDHVKQGALLFRLDARKAEAALMEAEAQAKAAQVNLERSQALFKTHSITAEDYQQAVAATEVARAVLVAKRHELEDTRIVAPFSGAMGECDIRPGLFVTKGTILSTLVEVDDLKAELRAPENLLPRLKAGQKLELTVSAYPDQRFSGKVYFIAPQFDPATGTILVKARVANVENRLRPGMHASINLQLAP